MTFSAHRLRRFAWVALFAMLVGALAPVVSRVLVAGDGGWAEVCSASGVIYLPVDAATGSDEGGTQHVSTAAACAYCLTHAGSFGLAAAVAAHVDASDGLSAVLQVVPPGPLALAVYGISSPRAPPALV
jgi:hypothetical protein